MKLYFGDLISSVILAVREQTKTNENGKMTKITLKTNEGGEKEVGENEFFH